MGLASTLLPGILWAKMDEAGATSATPDMLKGAAAVAGLEFTDAELDLILKSVNQNLDKFKTLRSLHIPNDVSPPFYFSPIVEGMVVNKEKLPFRTSKLPTLKRPANLESAAYWPVVHLAQLIKTRQVTSVELTEMYLGRLKKHNEKINCVVTFLDDVAMAQAKQADTEIAAGKYRGPLHGIPWGAKDIIAVKGYKTTWGSGAYKDQYIDEEGSIVKILRDAGAVLLAKLSTGELAGGDVWFGGRTNNPWKLDEGSSGSSAGPASATAAGLVPFAIGSETGGSILSPSARCGATGLRPTFGRVSRHGVMALSWTQDRLGPFARCVEDCAVIMSVIAKPDGKDLSVSEIPFNWDARLDISKLKVGYLKDAFDDPDRNPDWVENDNKTLEKLRQMGVRLTEVSTPNFPMDVSSFGVESGAFFDELVRSGRVNLLTTKNRGTSLRASRLTPAVEFLQIQRLRTMMMQKLAEATAGVDVYLAPSTNSRPTPPGGEGGGGGGGRTAPRGPMAQHFSMANLACYPGCHGHQPEAAASFRGLILRRNRGGARA